MSSVYCPRRYLPVGRFAANCIQSKFKTRTLWIFYPYFSLCYVYAYPCCKSWHRVSFQYHEGYPVARTTMSVGHLLITPVSYQQALIRVYRFGGSQNSRDFIHRRGGEVDSHCGSNAYGATLASCARSYPQVVQARRPAMIGGEPQRGCVCRTPCVGHRSTK